MPTVLTHAVVAVSSAYVFKPEKNPMKFVLLSIICSMLPDADVIGYQYFYIPYDDFFGHRGFFHSPFFAALVSIVAVGLFFRKQRAFSAVWWKLVLYFFILTASHGLLDAMTNGGRGIALLSPLTNERFFFPWRPLEVSPFSITAFLNPRGLAVLKSEVVWIWAPVICLVMIFKILRRHRKA